MEPEDPPPIHEPLPTIQPSVQSGKLDVTPIEISTPQRRNFEEAVINACQVTDSHPVDQKKTLFIADTLQLKPLAMFDKYGTEQNVLAHGRIVNRIIADNETLIPVPPLKRSFDEMDNVACEKCAPKTVAGLERVLASSPYTKLIRQRQYVELSPEVSKMLNYDWELHPQVKYFTAKVLSGAILHNIRNDQAIMLNTVESYGRTKHVDIHRETFGKEKDTSISTSLPPPIDTMYPDVWPVSLQRQDGIKLVIGTQVSNVLVTSSIRLDIKMKPCVGSKCLAFQLTTTADSLCTKIYLDFTCLQEGLTMIESPTTSCISTSNIIYQLRQIRSKFSSPTAYTLCRSSGPITKSHACHPFSVFTLADYDRGNNPGAYLFRTIGVLVMKHGENARLPRSNVEELVSRANGRIKVILADILRLYPSANSEIPILKNDTLNKHLSSLANLLMPSIVSANESVAVQIAQVFDFVI